MSRNNTTGRAKLFVGQLPPDAAEQELRDLFGCYGVVRGVYLQRDGAGRSKGSAFVTFDTTDEADTAIYTLHGRHKLRMRRKLTVIYARSTIDSSGFGRSRDSASAASGEHNDVGDGDDDGGDDSDVLPRGVVRLADFEVDTSVSSAAASFLPSATMSQPPLADEPSPMSLSVPPPRSGSSPAGTATDDD
jgi:RNA recognition motif-containing protein